MGKGSGVAAALVLATEAPEGSQLAKLLVARCAAGDRGLDGPPRGSAATVYDAKTPPGITMA
eukprot:gene22995-18681_t